METKKELLDAFKKDIYHLFNGDYELAFESLYSYLYGEGKAIEIGRWLDKKEAE